jgi:hypothetical protein
MEMRGLVPYRTFERKSFEGTTGSSNLSLPLKLDHHLLSNIDGKDCDYGRKEIFG